MEIQATGDRAGGAARIGDHVFLTGATGLLGGQILRRILDGHPRTRVAVLVRPRAGETACDRVDRLLVTTLGETAASGARDRVDVVEGDIVLGGLGLSKPNLSRLVHQVDHVIHCAAAIRFDLPLDVARRINREGTRHVIDLADRMAGLQRFDYVGTAYVAGRRAGLVKEDELDVGQQFWNSYERTKMEAERLVRDFAARRPAAIYRPSIIVGDSRTGLTTRFQGLYQLLPLYMRRLILAIPADPETHVDLVPIDYVLDALFALMATTESIGRCFHLASGPGRTCTIAEIVTMISDFSRIKPPPYVSFDTYQRFVKPLFHAVLWGKKRAAMLKGEHYLPYLSSKFEFDKTNTDAQLGKLGIRVPHATAYFQKLIAFQARTLRGGVEGNPEGPALKTAPARSGATP